MAVWTSLQRPTSEVASPLPTPLLVWMGVNALDLLLTFYLLSVGGMEGNPMLALALAHGGAASMLAVKLGLALVAGLTLSRMGRLALLRAANRLMSLVVVYNAGLLTYLHWTLLG